MQVHTNIPLSNYTTMKLGGRARFMTDIHDQAELEHILQQAGAQQLPVFVLGGGSNTIARDEGFNGIVARNRIMGYEVIEDTPSYTTIRVGGGELWDDTVKKTVEANLSGIEALSAIPGTVGASPVQNIGAYGQEVSDSIKMVEAYDMASGQAVSLTPDQCGFSYRHSIFRGEAAGRYFIMYVTFQLSKNMPQPPFYKAIDDYFDANNVTIFTPHTIRDAVTAIRADKLPDPRERPNTGSFFKNAIIEDWQYQELIKEYPDMPSYDMPSNQYKIPTGWLIEKTGLKGKLINGMRVHDKNALVLINESASSYNDLAQARDSITGAVRDLFRIEIQQEPLEI